MAVTHRNRLATFGTDEPVKDFSFVVDVYVAHYALGIADICTKDSRLRVLSLRYFDALTLRERENFTEAFVVGWSLIESCLQSTFDDIWHGLGFSNNRIKEMLGDWTASHTIDLLAAVGRLAVTDATALHRLRKLRNKIVHDLYDATNDEAAECLEKAADLMQLPKLAEVNVGVANF